jgi:hypothetical protein
VSRSKYQDDAERGGGGCQCDRSHLVRVVGGPSFSFYTPCCPPLHLIGSISTRLEIRTKTDQIWTKKISCDKQRVRQKDGGKMRQLYKYRTLNMAAVPTPPAARLSVL